jgi:glycosyltransferase involved in cell wall biosynthesis
MASVSVVLLTFNEDVHIARAIGSVSTFARDIYVVDSGSTDRTVEIARSLGAQIAVNKFVNQAQQFQWALTNLPITTDWIMRLDADEVVEPDLASRIESELPGLPAEVTGVNLKRKHIFMNKWVRHGGRYPLLLMRIFRRGQGRMESRWMDEHIEVVSGRTVTIDGGFADHNLRDISHFTSKHNSYATREAIEVLLRKHCLNGGDQIRMTGTSRQAAAKRWLKEHVYNHVPFTVSAAAYFVWRYVFQLGFLDGRSGLVYHFLQGFWYRFLVGAKLMELERAVAHLIDRDAIAAELSHLTGHNVSGVMSERTQ